jgi:hypothetical protein
VRNSFAESAVVYDDISTMAPVVTSFKINSGALSTANGVVTLWAGGPSMPLTFANFFNIAIDAVAFIVAGIAGLTMVGSLGELVGGGEE